MRYSSSRLRGLEYGLTTAMAIVFGSFLAYTASPLTVVKAQESSSGQTESVEYKSSEERALPAQPGAQQNPNESWIKQRKADPVEPGEPAPGPVDPKLSKQASAMLPMTLAALQTGQVPGAVISNGTVSLGVHNLGHLNYGGTGVRYTPNGADALIPGCPCEGWGIADATSRVSGYANRAMGTRGLEVESFKPDSSSATSVAKAGSTFRVTHQYIPAPETPNLYAITVTVENISGNTVDARYRRVMDWDVPPEVFYEYVTNNNGDSPAVLYMSDNGFASADPLSGPSRLYRDGDMVDAGPGDIGALFDFKLGPIEPGKKTSFKIYYGAGPDEATMTGALKKVKAEAYSLGEPSVDPTQGKPNTFAFGFKRSAGRSYVQ